MIGPHPQGTTLSANPNPPSSLCPSDGTKKCLTHTNRSRSSEPGPMLIWHLKPDNRISFQLPLATNILASTSALRGASGHSNWPCEQARALPVTLFAQVFGKP